MSKSDKPKLTSVFLNGIITENPTFRLVLGTCPTIATTTSVINAVGMGAAASFVLIGSNFVISLLRNFIPRQGAHTLLHSGHMHLCYHSTAPAAGIRSKPLREPRHVHTADSG